MKAHSTVGARSAFSVLALHFWALWAFCFEYPAFQALRGDPWRVVDHLETSVQVIAICLALGFFVPLIVIALLRRFWSRNEALVREIFEVCFLFLIALPLIDVARRVGSPESIWSVVAGLLGSWSLGRLYKSFGAARTFVTFLGPAIVLVPLQFLIVQAMSAADRPADSQEVKGGSERTSDGPPIIMIIFDEFPLSSLLRPDLTIDAERFPNFAALAATSRWFRNASAVTGGTAQAVPAILTGRYPVDARGRVLPSAALDSNIFSILGSSHALHVFEQITSLCPVSLCHEAGGDARGRLDYRYLGQLIYKRLLPDSLWVGAENLRSLLGYGPRVDRDPMMAKQAMVPDQIVIAEFLRAIQRQYGRQFYFLHVTLPHQPYCHLPSGRSFRAPGLCDRGILESGLFLRNIPDWLLEQQHLLQVMYTDRVLGHILSRLKEQDIFDKCILVVTADHGVNLRPHKIDRSVTPQQYSDILSIPLFLKVPQQRVAVSDDRNAESIDIVPTLLRLLGKDIPADIEGIDLLSLEERRTGTKIFYQFNSDDLDFTGDDAERFEFDGAFDSGERVGNLQRLFSAGKDGLYAVAGNADLLGMNIELIPGEEVPLELNNAQELAAVDPESGYVPAFIEGQVQIPAGKGSGGRAALALNGMVRAVVPLGRDAEGRIKMQAMLPEEAFQKGRNQVRIKLLP